MNLSFPSGKYAKDVRGSRTKLFLMLALLVGVVVAMIALSRSSAPKATEGEETRPLTPEELARPPGPQEGPEPAPWATPAAQLPVTDEEVKKQFAFLNDPKSLDQLMDRGTDLEPHPFYALLHRLCKERPEDLKAEALKDQAAAPLNWTALWERPETVRGKALAISGTITRIWEQPLVHNPMGLRAVTGYRLSGDRERPDGHPMLFDVYTVEKLLGALRHDHVVAYGRFLKPRTVEPESRHFEDPSLEVAVVLAHRFEPLTYLDAAQPPQPITDGNRPEARAFYWFVKSVRKISSAQLRRQASPTVTYLDLTANAARFRGQAVVLRGELRRLIRLRLDENPLGLADIFYGQIADEERKIVTFYCLGVPDGIRLHEGVVLIGYFFKYWSYWSRGGEDFPSQEIASPILIVPRLERIVIPKDYTMQILIIAIATVTVGALLIAQSRERNARRQAEEARRQRLLQRVPRNLNEIARQLAGQPQPFEPPAPKPDAKPEERN